MLIYTGTKDKFLNNVEDGTIVNEITDNLKEKMNKTVSKSEINAFENSLRNMHIVLSDSEIPINSGVAIEYNVPLTAKRVDFIITGFDDNKTNNAVIIELKQWSSLNLVEDSDGIVETYVGKAQRKVVHPSYQAWSYAVLINDYNENVQKENILLEPCAFLHNYKRQENDPLDNKIYEYYLDKAPVFVEGEVKKLREFIKKSIKYGDDKETLYLIDNGKLKPSKSLQDSLVNMIKGKDEFNMIDEQKVVYEEIMDLAKMSKEDEKKRVLIVEGGPGTGKTVVAINALASINYKGSMVQYATKNAAPKQVYLEKLKEGRKVLDGIKANHLFKSTGTYYSTPNNFYDALIIDEGHRLKEKSGMFNNLGENQIKEIIHASKFSVFFIDEKQRVHIHDNGSVSEIEKWANYYGAEVYKDELASQFRCNGSDGYLAFLDNLLDIRETANYSLEGFDYDFKVVDSPRELHNWIIEKNQVNNKSRLVAGYCWDWNAKNKKNTDYHDIKIDDFSISWNLDMTKPYATGVNSVNEAGCIHTVQGLEFDYVGVIIGKDIRYENGKIVTDFNGRANTDRSLFGIKGMYKENEYDALKLADEVIKNTYRVLMTRGMKGCYIYCCDEALQEYIKGFIK